MFESLNYFANFPTEFDTVDDELYSTIEQLELRLNFKLPDVFRDEIVKTYHDEYDELLAAHDDVSLLHAQSHAILMMYTMRDVIRDNDAAYDRGDMF